jgi:hypothetical protein
MGDASETLLHLKNRSDDSETGNWIKSLVTDALEIAAHGDAEQQVQDQDVELMVKWVAQIFNEFELYKIEFNKNAAGTDLVVDASPLNLENLSATNDHFEAHLSTRYWTLAFDASTRKLDIYLIPSQLLLAFTTNTIDESEYQPFITFTPRRHSDEYYWFVDDRWITFDMLPKLAKELFGDLIQVASGNISEEEFRKNTPNEVNLAAERAAEIAATDRSYEAGSTDIPDPAFGGTPIQGEQPETVRPPMGSRETALTEAFFQKCMEFSNYLDSEMHAVIEFAKLHPENAELLQNCKVILTEMDSLRVASNESADKLRKLI